MPLNDTRIRSAKPKDKPYKLTDGKGLFIEIRPTGAKLWRYRYRIEGKANVYAIGEYFNQPQPGHVSLDDARAKRIEARNLVRQGIHPKVHRDSQVIVQRSENANTFGAIYKEWHEREKRQRAWKPKYAGTIQSAMERFVLPTLKDLPIKSVMTPHILAVIDPVEAAGKAVTAINIRQWCSGVFSLACRTGRAVTDPTYPLLRHISKPDTVHKKPLNKDGIKAMRERIEKSGFPQTRIALHLLLLTFVRPQEMRQAEWKEFDLERAVWVIPFSKMKKKAEHRVPLSTQALTFLRRLHAMTGDQRWLFPNTREPSKCMSESTMNALLRRNGYAGLFSAHGFRATASTELHELGYDSDIIEFQLSHEDRDETRASYNMAQFWDVRKAMMQKWADMIDGWCSGGGNVVPIGSAKAA